VLASASRDRELFWNFHFHPIELVKAKIVSARRRNQHARRVRYPDFRSRCGGGFNGTALKGSNPD